MRVLPRSHREGVKVHGTAERQGNLLSINQEIPDDQLHTAGAVDLELRAGQMSVHHGRLVHASNPNRSTRRRCGLVARYISPAVRQVNPDSYGGPARAGAGPRPRPPSPLSAARSAVLTRGN